MARSKTITDRVSKALTEFGVTKADGLLIGVSGGVDSIVLAAIISRIKRTGAIKKIAIAHLNHNLRGKASDSDAAFVKKCTENLGVEYFEGSADVTSVALSERLGIEETARLLRYDFFISVATEHDYKWVVTAHNADDQLETMLMNIVRGSGVNGIRGIPSLRQLTNDVYLIRPMLGVSRHEIEVFAKENKVKWREDHSNTSEEYTRNRIRKYVIPALRLSYPDKDIYKGVSKLAGNMSEVSSFIHRSVSGLHKKAAIESNEFFIQPTYSLFKLNVLKKAEQILVNELIQSEIQTLLGKHYSLDSSARDKINKLLSASEDNTIQLSKAIRLSVSGLIFQIDVIRPAKRIRQPVSLEESADTAIGLLEVTLSQGSIISKNKNVAYISRSYVDKHGLIVRNWMPADRIQPFGMKGTRSVSTLLSEAGVKTEQNKRNFPIIAAADAPETVLWVPGIRASELCRTLKGETAYKLKRIV